MESRPRRILVVGVSGSGKTTLAARIGRRLGIRHVELDDLHWGPGWSPRETFLDDVRALAASEEWVTEWQYADARPLLLDRADTVVWLDPPTAVTLSRCLRRTVSRRVRRTPLWSAGLVEPPLWTVFTERDHILRWAWRTRAKYRRGEGAVPERLRGHPDVALIRLRTARETERWLDRLAPAG